MWLLIYCPSASSHLPHQSLSGSPLFLPLCLSLLPNTLSFLPAGSKQKQSMSLTYRYKRIFKFLKKHLDCAYRYKISNSASLSLSSWSCSSMTLFIQAASATALSFLAFSNLWSSTSPSSSAARILRSASWWTGKLLQLPSQAKSGKIICFCWNIPVPPAPAVLSFSAEHDTDESGNACGSRELLI